MKRTLKIVFIILGTLIALILMAALFFIYKLNYEVKTVDRSKSPDEKYELLLQSIGTPVLFGPADGKIVLKNEREKIAEYDFTLSNDGVPVKKEIWQVSWMDWGVQVVLSGSEQEEERIEIMYDGTVFAGDSDRVSGDTKQQTADKSGNAGQQAEEGSRGSEQPAIEENGNTEEQLKQMEIMNGYQAIYEEYFQRFGYGFTKEYDATGTLRAVLREDSEAVEYLIYDRESQNGKCGLYVYYLVSKEADGSWYPMDAEMRNTYAYVYESGQVVSSGKTDWSDAGSEEYQDVTGE